MASPFKLSVCPHDTAKNLLGWFTLNTYLQRNLGTGIHFEPQDNFLVERQAVLDKPFHVVYANPYSALCFARDKGFVPVARPAGVVDETVVVRKAGAAPVVDDRTFMPRRRRSAHSCGQVINGRPGLGACRC